ncbi:mandelate racemase/muconate lactonizing enzyme family protein [Sphingobium sp. CECT 9361]|uniref:mandelate racemase/muconate lactonizing enzyme family protein n=1 Tax=Sphingobium sp. CECT 9361 TaxID=2845384 RepID=UPI001E5513A6|nr:mandelate racemase/muconate lactonizing enzyme family protein [Sphingobium sp. CECT 9361]CAH0354240.1 D-galactonate dehydratase [Sphingobium sp. CECT 9361]
MKITSVEILRLKADEPTVIDIDWNPTIIKINTDEGIYGLGEIGLAYGAGELGQAGLARDFAKVIIGMDPFRIEAIWETLYRRTFWAMGGGVQIFSVMSAIDIALWDLKGKALGVPVYELLGGKTNSHLRTYASQLQFNWDPIAKPMVTPQDYAESTRKAMDQGYDCVKVNPIGFDLQGRWMKWNNYGILTREQVRTAVNRLAAIREEGGDDLDIIVELHCHTDANTAIQLCQELEQFRCLYVEEATGPLNWKAMKRIGEKVNIPIATGERIWSRWGFRPFFENQVVQIAQPDVGICGGFSEAKRICDMASVYDIGIQLHMCGSPIATAAALQLEAVIPNFVIHEHNAVSLVQANIDLCLYDCQPKNGVFEVPDRPGIGQDLTEKAIQTAVRHIVE